METEIYNKGTTKLIKTLKELQAQNKANNQTIKQYEQEYEIRNNDNINKYIINVVTYNEKNYARAALVDHFKSMNTQISKSSLQVKLTYNNILLYKIIIYIIIYK